MIDVNTLPDLAALSAAPWEAHLEHDHPTACPWVGLAGEGALLLMQWLCHEQTKEAEAAMVAQVEANASFIAWARNNADALLELARAEEIQVRRGWTAVIFRDRGGWEAADADTLNPVNESLEAGASSPAKALIAADEYLKAGEAKK